LKLVVDTNVLISGSLWQGPCGRLISAALQGKAQMFLSLPMLLEFRGTIEHPKFAQRLAAQGETAENLANKFRAACHEAFLPSSVSGVIPPPELRDRDDLHVLVCAFACQADAVVTGDKHLLMLKEYEGIPIIDVGEALRRLGVV
jgi:putative PIN family toxin of toxin-antitoxin system